MDVIKKVEGIVGLSTGMLPINAIEHLLRGILILEIEKWKESHPDAGPKVKSKKSGKRV